MSQWFYLLHPAVSARSRLAASYLSECENLVEIGGFGTPIDIFPNHAKTITVIDPLITPYDSKKLRHIQGNFLDVKDDLPKEYGLVALGVHLQPITEDTHRAFAELVAGSQMAVIEFSSKFQESRDILNYLYTNIEFSQKLVIKMDFSDNSMEGYDHGFPLHLERELYVLTPKRKK